VKWTGLGSVLLFRKMLPPREIENEPSEDVSRVNPGDGVEPDAEANVPKNKAKKLSCIGVEFGREGGSSRTGV
jgi:hypothetical protein